MARQREQPLAAEVAPSTPAPAAEPAAAPDLIAEVTGGRSSTALLEETTRRIAYARKAVRVYLDGNLVQLMGGEFILEPNRVEQVAVDEAFLLVPVRDEEHAQEIVAGCAADIAADAGFYRQLGYHLVADGSRIAVPWDSNPRRVVRPRQ